jgi:glycosyltransferase involved in cell wall biosynthesis
VPISHPRWFVIPKLCRSLYGFFFLFSILPKVAKLRKQFNFDLIYAPWVYPDGFACILLGMLFKKPVVVHALGCDINQFTKFLLRRCLIVWCLKKAACILSVSQALKNKMETLGVLPEKIFVIPNGVDKSLFRPMNRSECRRVLEFSTNERHILFIGSLELVKGVFCLIDAFEKLLAKTTLKVKLVIVGKGTLRGEIEKRINSDLLKQSVILIGEIEHSAIPVWINSSDVFCLPSIREGMPNVLLETLACGRPIIATKVGGVPEMLANQEMVFLVDADDSFALSEQFLSILQTLPDSDVHYSKRLIISWKEHASLLEGFFKKVLYRGSL